MLGLPLRSSNPDLADKKYIAAMFASGEQGAWYDPSDLSTMYQDAAGTIPVTAVGQPVGLILDKSGRGNHATQSTTASRPTLSARVNLLTKTEQFNDAAWNKYQVPISINYAVGPFGTNTAYLFIADTNYGEHVFWQNFNVLSGIKYKFLVFIKKHTTSYGLFRINDSHAFNYLGHVDVNLNTKTISGASGTSNLLLTDIGNEWFKVEFTAVATYTESHPFRVNLGNSSGYSLYTGDGVSGVYVGGVDCRVANESANLPAYQRVNTVTDYDTAGFPYYLLFDGVDDYLSTGSIDFTATDTVTMFAGLRKLSNSAPGQLFGLGPAQGNGRFTIEAASQSPFDNLETWSGGTTFRNAKAYGYAAPISSVVASFADVSEDRLVLRVNGTMVSQNSGDQGTGNYGNYPIYIGRQNGVRLPFNGRLYGLIVRGAATDDNHLTHAEKYLAYKSGVSL